MLTLSIEQGGVVDCKHANVALEWGFNAEMEFAPVLWGCSRCDVTSPERLYEYAEETKPHSETCEGEDCIVCKMFTLGFGSNVDPTRNKNKVITDRDKRWSKDMPAYKALRAQGLQPPRIDGSAELAARAETRFEVESGKVMPGKAKEIDTALRAFEDATGKSALSPNTTPVNL